MAKRNKIAVTSIKDLFLDGYYTDERAAQVMKFSIWPLAVAAYNSTEGRVKISHIQNGWATEENYQKIELALPQGFNIASLVRYVDSDDYGEKKNMYGVKVRGYYGNDHLSNNYSTELVTANLRYAVAKLSSGSHPIRKQLHSMVFGFANMMNDRFRGLTDKFVDTLYGESISCKPTISTNSDLTTYAIRYFAGDISKADIPANIYSDLAKLFSKYKTAADKFDEAVDRSVEALSGHKWVLYSGVNGGLIVGKLHTEGLVAALNKYKNEGSLPHSNVFTYLVLSDMPVPFRWYPSLEAMPEDQRREIEIQLVMLKAHVGHDTLLPSPDKYRNMQKVWDGIGAACYGGWGGECPMFLLNGSMA